MHKVFISYHHQNDQYYKEKLLRINDFYKQQHGSPIFIDMSVDTGDISEDFSDEIIRQKIRDEYLKDSTVTILLLGTETKYRKHIDWEIYSSMYDGKVNKKSGILVINVPSNNNIYNVVVRSYTEQTLYPEITSWRQINNSNECKKLFPHLPDRIIDNLPYTTISVTNWDKITNDPRILKCLIDLTFKDRMNCRYDLSRPMKRKNLNQVLTVSPPPSFTRFPI